MYEAFQRTVRGSVVVLVRDASVLLTPPRTLPRPHSVVQVPGLIYGSLAAHLRDVARTVIIATRCDSISVVGADVMDGLYSERASIRRFMVPFWMSLMGLDSRVLGFSWNESPPEPVQATMRLASRRVELLARDPISAARLKRDGADRVRLVSDLAFLTMIDDVTERTQEIVNWARGQKAKGRTVVTLNLNYALSRQFDQVAYFKKLVDQKTAEAFSFVLLPHDSRGPESDEFLAQSVYTDIKLQDNVYMVDKILSPGNVAKIASVTDFVVTGRMHLAIISATVGTPALSLSYQGKVEGLYESIGSTHWIDPMQISELDLIEAFDRIAEQLVGTQATLRKNLERLRNLAILNMPS
ncbi:polysaccharide pyruvyl transferase family protein [Actinomycetes bacterium M1A6_2h]